MDVPSDTSSFSAADLALWSPASSDQPLEALLVSALARSHLDPAILRVLPLFVSRAADFLDWERTRDAAAQQGLGAELGFVMELAGTLARRAELVAKALELRETALPLRPYFPIRGAFDRQLVEAHTPAVARRWGFLMNMGEDSFRAAFEKFSAAV